MSSSKIDIVDAVELGPGAVPDGDVKQLGDQGVLQENVNPFRKSFLRLYGCLFVAYLCAATNGYDANTNAPSVGGLSAIHTFTSYFGITTDNLGIVVALYLVGSLTGCFFAGPCADRYGRRVGMIIGSIICIVGAIVQTTARNVSTLMGGRFILGLGATLVQTAGPAYVVEMAYPKYRGVLTGAYQTCFFLGTIVSTWLEYGLNYVEGTPQWTWRLPMALQALPSVLVLTFVWLIPESPRWYVGQGRIEEARHILVKYHGDGDPNSAIVALEMEEMLEVISVEGSDKRWWDFRDLFNSRSARYRTFLVSCIALFGELDLPPTSYYIPLMAKTAGITSERTQLLLNALQTPIMMAAALSGLRWLDKWGRRKLLVTSSIGMTISVTVITACTAQQAGKPIVGGVGIAFVYVFLVVFAFAWTPAQSLYPTEVLAFQTRAKGLAFMNLLSKIVSVFNTYVPPIAISRAGWRFYILYIAWDALGVLVIYLTFVETKGRNLEEIDYIFEADSPKMASLRNPSFAQQKSSQA